MVFSTDKNGIAAIEAEPGDSLRISYVGYLTVDLIIKENKYETVKLPGDIDLLAPIVVQKCRKFKAITIKKIRTGKTPPWFGEFIWTYRKTRARVALLLDSLIPNAVLKKLSFWVKKELQAPDSSIMAPFIISVNEVSDFENLPGKLISRDPIFYYPKKAGKQTIDFDSSQLRIPAKRIYIAFECIMDEKYSWKQKVKKSLTVTKIPSFSATAG